MSFNPTTWRRLDSISKASRRVLATLLVPQCACCRQAHQTPERLCAPCLASLQSNLCPPTLRLCSESHSLKRKEPGERDQTIAGINQLQSTFFYRDAVPDLLVRWKYEGMVELTDVIASLVAQHSQISRSYDLVTVIPCHWRRRLTRGFDHIWLLATALAERGLIEQPIKTLKHSKPLPFQHLREASDRHIDSDHFHTVHTVKGKRILLLDDVITSGTTIATAATALRRAGAAEVDALTVATARDSLLAAPRPWV